MASYATDQFGIERLVSELGDLKRQISELRTLQQSSANGLQILATPAGSALELDLTLAAGDTLTGIYQIIPNNPILNIWNCLFTVFVDLPSYPTLDLTYALPAGFHLTSGQKNMNVSFYGDWGSSDDSTGMRVFRANIKNNDTVSHHIYLVGKVYGPYTQNPTGTL